MIATCSAVLTFFRRLGVWLLRISHRRGYGVHSPFAFSFITDVIYERGIYYAYAPLHEIRKKIHSPLREKDDRLLLRIANAAAPRTALVWSANADITLRYLRAGRTSCDYIHVATDEKHPTAQQVFEQWAKKPSSPPIDLLYVDDPAAWPSVFRYAAGVAGEKACFVVRGIHRNARVWREVCADERVRVTLDLYDFGIACFEARLNKQDYIVNYF